MIVKVINNCHGKTLTLRALHGKLSVQQVMRIDRMCCSAECMCGNHIEITNKTRDCLYRLERNQDGSAKLVLT
jgi:hypothetical protein